MPKLSWDRAGSRLFEAGVDRGVLYLEDDSGVAWNGLTSVEEEFPGDESEPVYFDGVKVNDTLSTGDFAATLSAFTYPPEFLPYEGTIDLGDGLFVDGQNAKTFGLSFRTLVGNDQQFTDLGYRIHILYNLTAIPGPMTRSTITDSLEPVVFTWKLSSVPVRLEGFRPTAHVIFDSRLIPADILSAVERILYGDSVGAPMVYDGGGVGGHQPRMIDGGYFDSEGIELPETDGVESEARLPTIDELISLVTLWGPRLIIPNTATGIAQLIHGDGDFTQSAIEGVYVGLAGSRLVPAEIDGLYTLS